MLEKHRAEGDFFEFKANYHLRCLTHVFHLAAQTLILGIEGKRMESEPTLQAFITDSDYSLDALKSSLSCSLDPAEPFPESKKAQKKNPINIIREVLLKIKRSEALMSALHCSQMILGQSQSNPILDVKTRWNSTFEMIQWAIKNKEVINIIKIILKLGFIMHIERF